MEIKINIHGLVKGKPNPGGVSAAFFESLLDTKPLDSLDFGIVTGTKSIEFYVRNTSLVPVFFDSSIANLPPEVSIGELPSGWYGAGDSALIALLIRPVKSEDVQINCELVVR